MLTATAARDHLVTTGGLNCINTHLIGFSIRRSNPSENT